MSSFKQVALEILESAGKPLHSREITRRAMAAGKLETAGKTPEATMNAQLVTDINKNGEKSRFIKTGPSTFAKNPHIHLELHDGVGVSDEAEVKRLRAINDSISSRQKGDIAEARIAELVTLFGSSVGLSCYRPISDDEGIDLIVKQRSALKVLYLQIKSRWQDKSGSLIIDIKERSITDSYLMGVVVCMFDVSIGDLWEYVWYIPAPDFVSHATKTGNGYRMVASKKGSGDTRWDPFLIDKRDLADKLIEQLGRI